MAEESDGIGEVVDDSLRVALTVASQLAERINRERERMARAREASAQQEYRELQTRFESERGAARASLAPVQRSEWWDTAGVDDIAAAHETASVWKDHDDVAREAADTIRTEVQDRYGIDVDAPEAGFVGRALFEAGRDRADAAAERTQAGEELTTSQQLLAAADRRERDAELRDVAPSTERHGVTLELSDTELDVIVDALRRQEGALQNELENDRGREDEAPRLDLEDEAELIGRRDMAGDLAERIGQQSDARAGGLRGDGELAYDSSERRQQFAASLEGKADKKVVNARVLADGENANHPRGAVSDGGKRGPKARRNTAAASQERTRGGLAR
jgi:colicin import membrane protein